MIVVGTMRHEVTGDKIIMADTAADEWVVMTRQFNNYGVASFCDGRCYKVEIYGSFADAHRRFREITNGDVRG